MLYWNPKGTAKRIRKIENLLSNAQYDALALGTDIDLWKQRKTRRPKKILLAYKIS